MKLEVPAMARVNRAIELLVRGEVIYYTGAGELSYENGLAQAATWADFLMVDFEHHAFDPVGLTAFMRGLVDGGPLPGGHCTPAVIATLPSNCRTVAEVEANAWQIRQVLTAGVHGVLHTHARRADAVRAFVEHCRYPFRSGDGLGEGQRGSGGQQRSAEIWGVSVEEYLQLADPWPLNPEGELLLGLKMEDRQAVANAREIAAVPGIAFAEWGPGDMGMAYGYADAHDPPYPPEMDAARRTIKAACDAFGLAFLCSWNDPNQTVEQNVRTLLADGVRIISGGGEETARIGRSITESRPPA
jgi:4-hydroxy-2-oxoheptanedioate aldolase